MSDSELAELQSRYSLVETAVEIGRWRLKLLHPRSADELISEEEFNRDERLPYWAEIWPSAVALAGRLAGEAERRAIRGGDRLLELGCGAGLVTTLAAKLGLAVTAADYYGEALRFADYNAGLNGGQLAAARVLDWRKLPDDLGQFDWVVAADVLYERDYAELVATAIARTLKPGGHAIVTDPQRQKAATFPEQCRQCGLTIEKQGGTPVKSGSLTQTVDVYEIGWM